MLDVTAAAAPIGANFTPTEDMRRQETHGMISDVTPPDYLPLLAESGAGRVVGEWAAEPKLDGWRAIVSVDPSLPTGLQVRSRTGRFLTTLVPELAGLADLGFRMVLDGELVSVGDDNNVDFYALGQRMLTRRVNRAATLCAIDVLVARRHDCTQLPYRDRRRVLEMLELSRPAWCMVPRFPFDDAEICSTRARGCDKKESC